MNYTKGEWEIQEPEIEPQKLIIHSCWKEGEQNWHRHICRTFGYCDTKKEELANAQLIAAAPQMYEKLTKVKKWLEMLINHAEHQLATCRFETLREALESDIKNYKATKDDIEQALSKAEGNKNQEV